MARIILFGGMLAMLVAFGATTLAFKTIKPPQSAPHRVAKPIDPAMATLHEHLQNMREEMTRP
jgi:hypothetical protein